MIERLKQVEAALEFALAHSHPGILHDARGEGGRCLLKECEIYTAALDALSVQCPRCKGEGEVLDNETRVRLGGPMARVSPLVKCSLCDGTGRVMMSKAVGALIADHAAKCSQFDACQVNEIIAAFEETT